MRGQRRCLCRHTIVIAKWPSLVPAASRLKKQAHGQDSHPTLLPPCQMSARMESARNRLQKTDTLTDCPRCSLPLRLAIARPTTWSGKPPVVPISTLMQLMPFRLGTGSRSTIHISLKSIDKEFDSGVPLQPLATYKLKIPYLPSAHLTRPRDCRILLLSRKMWRTRHRRTRSSDSHPMDFCETCSVSKLSPSAGLTSSGGLDSLTSACTYP